VALYVLAYLALVQPKQDSASALGSLGCLFYKCAPSYRLGGQFSKKLFLPVQWLDQKLRPGYWRVREQIHCPDLDIPIAASKPGWFLRTRRSAYMTTRLLIGLVGVFVCIQSLPSLGQSPAKIPDGGALPEWHGIAIFGACSHHMDLVLAIVEGADRPSNPAKRLRAEIHLRDEQVPELIKCLDEGADRSEKVPRKEEFDRAQVAKEALDALEAMEELVPAQLARTLSAKQQARFEELACQFAGPMVLRLKYYAERLEVSPAQRKSIQRLVNTYVEQSAPLHRAGFVVWSPEAGKKLKALAGELDEKIMAILTEKQRAKWPSLLGKKFDWTVLMQE
jgi:hypothetical protein